MKKFFLLAALCLLSLQFVSAQDFRFAYFSYQAVLTSMPDYQAVQRNMATLRNEYEAEAKRSEEDFQQKYEDFLDGQQSFAPSILRKRQAEVQEMLDKNVAFKEESRRLLQQAENDAMTPVRQRLNAAVQKMGKDGGYAFVLNADDGNLPYVDAAKGTDITEALKNYLK